MLNIQQLEITEIHSTSDVSPYLDGWRTLAAGVPMQLPEWLLGWWKAFAASNDELWLLFLHAPDRTLVGLAPLYLQGGDASGTLRLLGAAESCSHHPNWLCLAGWDAQVGVAIARFLIDCQSRWKRLFFESIDVGASAIQTTENFLAENDYLLHRREINSCWKVKLPTTWDEYLQTLSRSMRKRCRKLQRQFLDSGIVTVRQVDSEAELRKGFEILFKLHGDRWGSKKKPLGVFSDQRFRSFHESVSRELLAQQKLRLAWLEVDEKPIAIEYQFFDEQTVYAYQAGVDLSRTEYSPGKLTMMAAIQFAFRQGCKNFDLLRGDNPYKGNWRATPVACYDLRVWSRGGLGIVAWGFWHWYTLVSNKLKAILPDRLINWALALSCRIRKI